MADLDLHKVAFPTLDDVHVATLAKFGTAPGVARRGASV